MALSTLAPKGCLILRMWALWEHQNVGLLFLVSCVFAEVKVCRPSTVQLAGEDIFLVCTGFKGLGQAHRAALCRCALRQVVCGVGAHSKGACLLAWKTRSIIALRSRVRVFRCCVGAGGDVVVGVVVAANCRGVMPTLTI